MAQPWTRLRLAMIRLLRRTVADAGTVVIAPVISVAGPLGLLRLRRTVILTRTLTAVAGALGLLLWTIVAAIARALAAIAGTCILPGALLWSRRRARRGLGRARATAIVAATGGLGVESGHTQCAAQE